MTPEEEFFLRRVRDVSGRSGRYGYLGFLNEAEAALCRAMARGGSLRPMTLYGGYPDAQRCMARFGSAEETGYEEPWPIARLILKPAAGRFSEDLTHRDVLGALMSMGIERDVLGDLVKTDGVWHIFCREEMVPHLTGLMKVRATPVRVEEASDDLPLPALSTERVRINVSSVRVDLVAAHLCALSRGRVLDLFRRQMVFLNGLTCDDPSRPLKEGDVLSLRGHGKYRCAGVSGTSRKGKLYLELDRYM